MDCRLQNMEQQLFKVDDLQETILGFREEMQMMGRSFRQELQTMTQEMRNIAHGVPHRNGHQRNDDNGDNRRRTQLPRREFTRYEKSMTELTHLRQAGSLAEFNIMFDRISARLDLPEMYLVDAYVGALKKDIADSARFFNPRTMLEARRMARVQELSLIWRSKKNMIPSIKNEPQEKSTESQECIVMQEEAKKMQESFSQEQSFCSKQRFCSSSFLKSEAGRAENSVGKKFIAVSLPSLPLSLQVERRQQVVPLPRNEQTGHSHVGSHNTPSRLAPSKITTVSPMLVDAILREPLSFFPLLLSLFRSRVQKTSQSGDNVQTSKNKEQFVDCTQKFTWLQRSQIEKSDLQLDGNFVQLQQYF